MHDYEAEALVCFTSTSPVYLLISIDINIKMPKNLIEKQDM